MSAVTMHVELLRFTHHPDEIAAMGAKLCYAPVDIKTLQKGIENKEQGTFIDQFMEMEHLSPAEHASFTFGIEGVSRSLMAQITRHRMASFSIKSQRYVQETGGEDHVFSYIVPIGIIALGEDAVTEFKEQMKQMQSWYNSWVEKLGDNGEKTNQDARFVLPNAAETKMIVTMNARELLHFFRLRCCNRAQWEIHSLADEMLRQVRSIAPELFRKAGPNCLTKVCTEGKLSCGHVKEVREKYKTDCKI